MAKNLGKLCSNTTRFNLRTTAVSDRIRLDCNANLLLRRPSAWVMLNDFFGCDGKSRKRCFFFLNNSEPLAISWRDTISRNNTSVAFASGAKGCSGSER